jgi:CMP-N-acetylneuraminic acid synthetase
LSPQTIRNAIATFKSGQKDWQADSLFTVNKFQTRFYRADGSAINHDPDNLIPTQDLEPWYEENSNLYLFTRDSFTRTQARIGKHPIMLESPRFESIDIDTPEDWDFAVIAARFLLENQRIAS